ncbi:MAG: amidohydrolase family protein [Deltaproteobacteria bacterium]|nr:amidohydrolase family protein [Deltaproteobacteria bacterium]
MPAVRTKSGAYNTNHPKYFKQLGKQIDCGRFKAMAEVLMYHAQKGSKAPEVIVYPDNQRVQTALNAAIEHAWPFVIHIEFRRSLSGEKRGKFMAAIEGLLTAHAAHSFALNHMGQLTAVEVRRLVKQHQNIYFLTAHTNPVIIRRSKQPWVNVFRGEVFCPEWKELLLHYADRFIFALDNVWETHWRELYLDQMAYSSRAMADLTHDVAHAVAHGNAERLWRIPMLDK